jgi:citrate lyase subunit beta / citryl-CoA lyase
MRPIRSLLFAPANRPELIKKFPRYAADVCAIDLEDAVPEAEKDAARLGLPALVAWLRDQNLKSQLFVRTNAFRSPHTPADLQAAFHTAIDGIIAPKLETLEGVRFFDSAVASAQTNSGRALGLIGLIETARGVMNVETIAAYAENSKQHLAALAFGAEDFITDVGGRRTAEGLEVLYARSRVVLAAKAAGLQAIDPIFANIRDDEGFRRDAEFGRQLGFNGKLCVTPRQTEIANTVFSPSAEEIDRSRRLIEVYEAAQSQGRGAIDFEGAMVDEPLLKRARDILELADRGVQRDEDR